MALFLDVECYRDYFLILFLDSDTGKQAVFEMHDGKTLNVSRVAQLMRAHTSIGFNSASYDLPMIAAALDNRSCAELKKLSDEIIRSNLPSWKVTSAAGVTVPREWDHIDIVDVIPGRASLKLYAARIGWHKLQELPVDPSASIAPDQREVLRKYCLNDVQITRELYGKVEKQIALRVGMSKEYNVDLRSKSDAQIAETVLKHEIEVASGRVLRPPRVDEGATVRYQNPGIVRFDDPALTGVFERILGHDFELAPNGSVRMPDWLKDERVVIGGSEYQMGVGGLHSCEKAQSISAGNGHVLFEADVASYYPSIILQQGIAPDSMGKAFTEVYQQTVTRRIAAKRTGDKVASDTLKIVLNGSFGKLGSKYSILYSPALLIQTTITGQLALLMLIERLEGIGAKVVSANTDGVVVLAPRFLEDAIADAMFGWELDTSYELERTDYASIHSRDVNNYVAVKTDGSVKRKGAFAPPGLMKNPQFDIVSEAIAAHLSGAAHYRDAIRECRDLQKFVMARRVTGGAVWEETPLGSSVRFYYSTAVPPDKAISYAKNSNKVPQSDGARPCLDMPSVFPDDVDFERYVGMAMIVMRGMGAWDA